MRAHLYIIAALALAGGGALLAFLLPRTETASPTLTPTVAGLPYCQPNDTRIPVPRWTATAGNQNTLSTPPPMEDGRVVYIELDADAFDVGCASDPKKLFSFSIPENPKDPSYGGLAVNFRGNVQFSNGMCYFRGFYMNEDVMGTHQGWIETYYGAVDRFKLITSNQYCAAG